MDIRGILRSLNRKHLQGFDFGWIYRPDEQAGSEINSGLSVMPNR